MLKTKPARIALLLCLLCIVALLTVTVVKAVEANGYHKVLIHEAGDPLPPAVRFLKNSDADAVYRPIRPPLMSTESVCKTLRSGTAIAPCR